MSKLEVTTPTPTEIHMTRVFDAPARLVQQAMTDPTLIVKWLGGKRAEVVACDVDYRVGGTYRYAFKTKDAKAFEFAFVGTFQEVGAGRVVHTEAMEGMPGESRITTTYTEVDGKTTLKLVMAFPTQEMRDMVIGTGMAEGAGESYDVLAQVLAAR